MPTISRTTIADDDAAHVSWSHDNVAELRYPLLVQVIGVSSVGIMNFSTNGNLGN
jgi:hypothetical protein